MKIQNLAIIFVILILPISLVLSSYTKTRVETLNLQADYDSKLNDATFDALKAYQVNSFMSSTGDYTNSKLRDIKASVNTFFNSMSSNFATLGYTKTTLQNYIPAIVYTMYDGYYIYSPYANTWWTDSSKSESEMSEQIIPDSQTTYSNGEKLYGLKPYVYYSCRYKKGNIDVTITYSLDNYIQIQGKVGDTTVSKYGYILDKKNLVINGDNVKYNGIEINTEQIRENVYVDGQIKNLQYIKKNGTKYYLEGSTVFTVLNGKKNVQSGVTANEIISNTNAIKYYKEAQVLEKFISAELSELTTNDIVDIETGKTYNQEGKENPYNNIGKIFDFDCNKDGGIESKESNFNLHRIDVIKNSIIRNLSIAIDNYNNYSSITTEFKMPKLTDSDWEKIMENISVISFMQGVNIGGKMYNGYSIITNTQNEDIVMEDSIYIKTSDNILHRIIEDKLLDNNALVNSQAVFNVNTERRTEEVDSQNIYYFPVTGTLSYDSIVTQDGESKKGITTR